MSFSPTIPRWKFWAKRSSASLSRSPTTPPQTLSDSGARTPLPPLQSSLPPSPPYTQKDAASPTSSKACLTRLATTDPDTTIETLLKILHRDGGVIIENFISESLAAQIKDELKPFFDTDRVDQSGFFPTTTQRATALLAHSKSCVDLITNPLLVSLSDALLTSQYTYWTGQSQATAIAKPTISSTVAFRVNPGGAQQGLHRDDADYHTRNLDMPMMLGFVTALTRTTAANGATIVIPGSHTWGPERMPLDAEAVPAELEIGDTLCFLGNTYHAGGANVTVNEARETVGIFLCKGFYRQAENQYLAVSPEKCRELKGVWGSSYARVLRLLGYGISSPSVGFVNYKDPMEEVFGIVDEDTVRM